jgi:hypothetical protein
MIGLTEEKVFENKLRSMVEGTDPMDYYTFKCIENHHKIKDQKVMLLCRYKSDHQQYLPVKLSYKLVESCGLSTSIIDDYLIKHKLVNPNSPIKNRWRKLGYKNDPNNKKSNTTISRYDEWTTDRKIIAHINNHIPIEDHHVLYGYGKYPLY